MDLIPFQTETVQRARTAIRQGARRILIVSPTGTGKTVIGSKILERAGSRNRASLFLAHRRELIYQCSDKLGRFGVEHGIILAGERKRLLPPCQVASIQTFASRVGRSIDPPPAHLLMIDEAHRSITKSYQNICNMYPESIVIGLTATPVRSDGRGLGGFYDAMIEAISIKEAISKGYLVGTRIFTPSVPDLTKVRTNSKGDYRENDLEQAMNKDNLVGDIVDHWLRLAEDSPTVVFASGISHSLHIKQRFLDAGIPCDHIDGTTDKTERAEILNRLDTGELKVVTSVGVLCEGWDQPSVKCCILARPTKSYGLYLQMAGRVLRTFPGKEYAIIIDHGGCWYLHGTPEEAGGWSLDPDKKIQEIRESIKKEEERKSTVCGNKECNHIYTGSRSCPLCGWVPTRKAQRLNHKKGLLHEVKTTKKKRNRSREEAFWESCVFKCKYLNKKIGAAAHMYKQKYDEFPPSHFKIMPRGKAEWNMDAGQFLEKSARKYAA